MRKTDSGTAHPMDKFYVHILIIKASVFQNLWHVRQNSSQQELTVYNFSLPKYNYDSTQK